MNYDNTTLVNAMYLYMFDLVLATLAEKFSLGQLTEINENDFAQVVAWRGDVYATPQPTSDDALPWITEAQTMLMTYTQQLSTNDFASLQYYLQQAVLNC